MKQRLHKCGIVIAAFSILLAWVGPVGAGDIRIGLSATADPEYSGIYIWARTFADELERAGIVATIYPGSTLGNEIVRTEQVLLGLLEVNVTGTQEVEVYSELVVALDLPFLLKNDEEADALMHHTGYLEEMNSETRPMGMRVVNLVGMGGKSGLFTARAPIKTVADVKNFRIRTMAREQLDWVEAWGGAGTQVAWEEVPQALQTGIADGYINPPIVAVLFGHGGQLDYFTDLAISPSIRVVVFSENWYQGLSEEERLAVDRAAIVAYAANREWMARTMKKIYQMLSAVGIELIRPGEDERDAFRELVLPTYNSMASAQVLEKTRNYMHEARRYLDQHNQEQQE